MNHDEFRKTVKEFEMPGDPPGNDAVIVNGLTPAYAEYHKEIISRRLSEVQLTVNFVIDALQKRNDEHMRIISDLLQRNETLKDKLDTGDA